MRSLFFRDLSYLQVLYRRSDFFSMFIVLKRTSSSAAISQRKLFSLAPTMRWKLSSSMVKECRPSVLLLRTLS